MDKKIDIIIDNDMKNAMLDFYSKVELNSSQEKYFNNYISRYQNINLETLNWETICDIASSIDSSHISGNFGVHNLNFVKYLIENNLYKDPFIDENSDFILNLLNSSTEKRYRIMFFDKNFNLKNLFICKHMYSYKDKNGRRENKVGNLIIDTKLDNPFLVKLLDGFYKSDFFSIGNKKNDFDFSRNFHKSYDGLSTFEDVTDFNFKVFEKQFNFYKENKNQLSALISFYKYLHSIYEDIFKPSDPVDIFWIIKHVNFANQFRNGFRLVDLNPMEPYPTKDRWMLRPNGEENYTTRLDKTNYLEVDFTKIEHVDYRPFLKDFFWKSTSTLLVRRGNFYYLVEFLNFIYEYKTLNIKNNSNYNEITSLEIYSYLGFISGKYSLKVYNDKVTALRAFLRADYFNVEPVVFDFLVYVGTTAPPGGKSIPENDLKILNNHLLNLSHDSVENFIYYIIFKLSLDTTFRISYILSITIDSIKEAMKKEQYYINAVTKTSNKEKVKEHISKRDYRLLENAIKITNPLRDIAPKEYKNFIFLQNTQRRGVIPINPENFNTFLKGECISLGLPKYTAENLRDTSITDALDFAVEKGLSPQETQILIRGKLSTKVKHYFDAQESKMFVEATYGVIIGNIDLKGQILETTDSSSFSKDELMDDGCGFCKENECRIHNQIGCPMCKFFIVTLDRIPFYIKKLEQLDTAIENETIEHEKEHLIAIKELYAAYLSKLLDLKHKLEIKQNQDIK